MSTVPEVVRVRMPASREHLRLARLVVAGMASQQDVSLDDIEDLRLAVGEICAQLVLCAPPGSTLELEILLDDDQMTVRARTGADPDSDANASEGAGLLVPQDDLMVTLLSTVTDAHGVDRDGDGVVMWFRRRVVSAAEP